MPPGSALHGALPRQIQPPWSDRRGRAMAGTRGRCGLPTYDDVQQAAAAWRAAVGEAAAGSEPQPLAGAGTEALRCLTEVDLTEVTMRGTETRAVWNEWFRALRRVHDVSDALERQGCSLPADSVSAEGGAGAGCGSGSGTGRGCGRGCGSVHRRHRPGGAVRGGGDAPGRAGVRGPGRGRLLHSPWLGVAQAAGPWPSTSACLRRSCADGSRAGRVGADRLPGRE